MPLFRFVFFAGGLIVCGFLASNYLLASDTPAHSAVQVTQQPSQSSLADWRIAEARKAGRGAEAAIVFPTIAEAVPTAERLAFERQLASNTVPAPVLAQSEPIRVSNARAEMTEATPQQPSLSPRAEVNKPRKKQAQRREIADAERAPAPRQFGGFLGGIFSN